MFLFKREMNDSVMVNQAKLFPSIISISLQLYCKVYYSYMLERIYIFSQVLTVNSRAMAVAMAV